MSSNPDVSAILAALLKQGGLPITVLKEQVKAPDLAGLFAKQPLVPTRFPSCADLLLSLCDRLAPNQQDEIDEFFRDYFRFGAAPAEAAADRSAAVPVNPDLFKCARSKWPPECHREPCVHLRGDRNGATELRRLWIGDVMFPYFLGDRMGTFRMLGMILDDFALKGNLPISGGKSVDGVEDDLTAMVLEEMVQQTQRGDSSQLRQRASLYTRAVGYKIPTPAAVESGAQPNHAFHDLFNQLIYSIEQYLAEKRVAVAIRGTTAPGHSISASSLISIRDTIRLLQEAMEPFYFGRNYTLTLHAIVWTIAGLSVVRALRSALGVADSYKQPQSYLAAAFDKYLGVAETAGQSNRFLVHRDAALNARAILMDVEVMDVEALANGQSEGLEGWIHAIEPKVAGYRTAYRLMTGVDLGVTANPATEQRA